MRRRRIIFISILSLITILSLFSFCTLSSSNNTIAGAWISENDSKSKLIFSTDGKCWEYYDNVLHDEYTYIVSNTSPQCDINVHVDQYTNYLQMTNINDAQDVYCYEINGISSTNLSLRFIENGGFIIYTKNCSSDTDGDGVNDCEDNCPNEAGPAPGEPGFNNGCPYEVQNAGGGSRVQPDWNFGN